MKRYLKITGIIAAILFVIVGLWSVDNFYYPFKSVSPNYADVERAFGRLQFPADWKEISSSENKGLFGRDCDPMNTSGCFHKSKTFKVPETTTTEDIKRVMTAPGLCSSVTETSSKPIGGDPYSTLKCLIHTNNVGIGTDVTYKSGFSEVSIGVDTQN